jgi:indolepyruvate ferredoxin oxidoreductase beta subunit
MESQAPRPIRVLIAALGGQGGGVLANWIIKAAREAGLIVQGSSIPGVAQRTGATTYYIEVFPLSEPELNGRKPVLAVYPIKGDVDLLVGGEIIEAGRMANMGYVTPGHTVTIASNHRAFTLTERMAMEDGRYPVGIVEPFLEGVSKRTLIFDAESLALDKGSAANAVIFGAIAGAGILPMAEECYRAAIAGQGRAVERNLRGFEAGLAKWSEPQAPVAPVAKPAPRTAEEPAAASGPVLPASMEEALARYPEASRSIVRMALARLIDFQGPAYARLFLDRLAAMLLKDDVDFTTILAKRLATWMTYEDVIRIADYKTRAERVERVRRELGAAPSQKVVITEFLKPGLDQALDLLPPFLAKRVERFVQGIEDKNRLHVGLKVPTTKIWGFVLLRLLSALRFWRPYSYRYRCEQERIESWLSRVGRAAEKDAALATEIVELSRLVKGYGDTHRRGSGNLAAVYEGLVDPHLDAVEKGGLAPAEAARLIREGREAALAEPEGGKLREFLDATQAGQAKLTREVA